MHIIIQTVNFSSQKIVTLETLVQRRLQLFLLVRLLSCLYVQMETAMLLRFLFVFWRARLLTSKLPTYPQHMLAHLKSKSRANRS
ncbi:unnamed protein product [Brassica rapa subsp. trilocularis]